MKRTRTAVAFIIVGLFIILFIVSTSVYFIECKSAKSIELECAINSLSDLNNVEKTITNHFNIDSNEIFVFNSGEIIFDNIEKKISKLYVELIIKNGNIYHHYQLQNEGNNIILIDFGTVNKENFQPYILLSNIIQPICALSLVDYKEVIKISLDSVVHEKVSANDNSFIYNESKWIIVSEEISGKYVSFIVSDGANNVNNIKCYYIKCKKINP